MGRSVGVDSEAIETVFLVLDYEGVVDDDYPDHEVDELNLLQDVITEKLHLDWEDKPFGREGRVIADGDYCRVTLFQYHDLYSVNLAPEWYDGDEDAEQEAIDWCERHAEEFRDVIHDYFTVLNPVARASNGEVFYVREENNE